MSGFIDSLNLRPQEKRLLGVIGVVVFLALNWIFVWPHFRDYARMRDLEIIYCGPIRPIWRK